MSVVLCIRVEYIVHISERNSSMCNFLFLTFHFQTLSCLVQIASVRRTLFSNEERAKFLSQLVNGVRNILQNPQVTIAVL